MLLLFLAVGGLFQHCMAVGTYWCVFVSVLEAYANGNLTDACSTMTPVHENAQPSNEPCLYETAPSQTAIVQGGTLTITLRNITNYSFKGYMTMAFDASQPDDAGPIGTFSMPTDGQILSCPNGVNNAISHQDNNSIKRNVQANWTAPVDFVGTVVFKTTFVRGLTAYWVKEPSENVTVNSSTDSTDEDTSTTSTTPITPTTTPTETTTAPPTTTMTTTVPPCGSASSFSFSWITGFILLMMAFSSTTVAV
uniref:Reelin domain-containing protein n=1 Tax=Daphnia galeata TaxID=27404 RepID=A0A8J2RGT8_9CRUS|nr:unnamed protein product [Daphnia galeata]